MEVSKVKSGQTPFLPKSSNSGSGFGLMMDAVSARSQEQFVDGGRRNVEGQEKDNYKTSDTSSKKTEGKSNTSKSNNSKKVGIGSNNKPSDDASDSDLAILGSAMAKVQNTEVNTDTVITPETVSAIDSILTELVDGAETMPELYIPQTDIYDDVLEQVAETLNVSLDDVKSALEDTGQEVPALQDGRELNKFLVEVFDVQDEISLLNIPQISKIKAEVTEVLNTELPKIQTFVNSIDSEILNQAKPEVVQQQPVMETEQNISKDRNQKTEISEGVVAPEAQEIKVDEKPQLQNQTKKEDDNEFDAQENMPDVFLNTEVVQNQQQVTNTSSNNTQNIADKQVLDQIVDKVKVELTSMPNNATEIKLSLRPEHLGDVTLKVRTENGIITAQFIAESQRVKEIIEANFNQLKSALSEQGLNLSGLSVSVGQDQGEKMKRFLMEQKQSMATRRISAVQVAEDDQTSEVATQERAAYGNTVEYSA